MHMAETGLCAHGEQEELIADGRHRDRRRACRSTPTVAASPTASRSAPRACARCYENVLQLRGAAGARQVPGDPRVGFTHVYGAPGHQRVHGADDAMSMGRTVSETFAGGSPARGRPGACRRGARLGRARRLPRRAPSASPATLGVLQFPNGSANLTYLLTFTLPTRRQQFVLRRPPFGVVAPGAHDMAREFRVLSRLWRRTTAPRAPSLFCADHDVVGADFVVSEYRRGEVVWAQLPSSMATLPDAGRRIGLATIDALADLHLVDPAACGLADLGRPDGYVERQLRGWRERWDASSPPPSTTSTMDGGRRAPRRLDAGVATADAVAQRLQDRQLPVHVRASPIG